MRNHSESQWFLPTPRIRNRLEARMAGKIENTPGGDHPIFITHNPARVIIRLEGQVVADTKEALTLLEANYPAVQYIPRKDVDPYKGIASYYGIPIGGPRSNDAAWSYEEPYPAVAEIKGYMAFYPDRVDSIDELEEAEVGVAVSVPTA
jgi:uncharacterized protein (DUF427 family)